MNTLSHINRTTFTSWPAATLIGLIMVVITSPLAAQAPATFTPDTLKKLSIEELFNLEVTSVSRRSEKLSEVASAIQVITREDIRRSGATSIPEALRLASNLHVAQKNSHDWAISARGFNTDLANKMLVLIDGRTVYTPLFSGVFWDRQDYLLEDIERIEIISGPGGTMWGSNAVNGVINIITRKANDTKGLYAEAGGGTQLRQFVGLRYGGQLNANTSYRVYGKFANRDEAVLPDSIGANDAWHIGQVGFRIDTKESERDVFTIQGDYYNSRIDVSVGGTSKVYGGNALARWTRHFSEASTMSVQLYYDRTHLTQPVPESRTEDNVAQLAPAGTLEDNMHTYDIDFQHNFRAGEHHRIIWGLGYRHVRDRVSNAPGLAFVPEAFNVNLISSFIQDEIEVTENFYFTLGTKIEHNTYTQFEFEPSTRLQWVFNEKHSVWSAVSRAVRIPSRVDRHNYLPTPGFAPLIENLLAGNDNFISETVIAYELGYRSQISSKVTGSLATFYNVYDRIRSTSTSPPPALFGLPLFYDNNLEGETHGVEAHLTYQVLPGWRLRTGYAFFDSDIRVKSGKEDFNNALNETADPSHRLTLQSFTNLTKHLEFDLSFRWVDSFHYNDVGVARSVDEYAELDARIAWLPSSRVELSVVGQNLLNDHHVEYVISNPNPMAAVERSVYGKIVWRW